MAWGDTPGVLGAFLVVGGGEAAGLVFDAATGQALRFTTVGSQQRILDGPVVLDWNFDFTVGILGGGGGATACTFELGYVPEAAAANYSTTLFPWGRNETTLGTFAVGVVPELPATLAISLSPTSPQMETLRAIVTSRAAWSGRLALSLRLTVGNPLEILAPTFAPVQLATTQEIFFAGLTGGPEGKARAVRDGRYGFPAFNTELIRDGDNPGLWVRPFDFDPEDEEATYRPRPGEGTIEDEIPDL